MSFSVTTIQLIAPFPCVHKVNKYLPRFELLLMPELKMCKQIGRRIIVDSQLSHWKNVRAWAARVIMLDRVLHKYVQERNHDKVLIVSLALQNAASQLSRHNTIASARYYSCLEERCYTCCPPQKVFQKKTCEIQHPIGYRVLEVEECGETDEMYCQCCGEIGYPYCQECYCGCEHDYEESPKPLTVPQEDPFEFIKEYDKLYPIQREEEFVIVRDPALVMNIRRIRRLLRVSHILCCRTCRYIPTSKEWVYCQYLSEKYVKLPSLKSEPVHLAKWESSGEEKNGPHGDDSLVPIKAQNTVLTETQVPSVTTGPHRLACLWNSLSSTDYDGIYNQLTQRWLPIKQITWDNQGQNAYLWLGILPLEILKSLDSEPCDVPLSMIFRTHQYVNFETMHVKIHLNSNKFQVGQIQATFWYEHNMDNKFMYRDNIWSASQNHHVLLNAGSSNDATLSIPWCYRKTYLTCKKHDGMEPPLTLGQLSIRVLNPLRTPSTVSNTAHITVFVSFDNLKFNGLKSGSIGTFESGLEERVRADSQILQPTRGVASTKYGEKLYGENFGDLKTLCRRYQYYGTFQGTVKESVEGIGKILCEIPLFAQGLKLNIPVDNVVHNLNSFTNIHRDGHIPIVLSGFRYFRGGLRFKFICPRIADVNFVVQHKPPAGYSGDVILPCNSAKKSNDFLLHTVATYVQNLGTNSIVEIEIPFYSPGCYTLLQNPMRVNGSMKDAQSFYTLGSLLLSFDFVGKGTPTFKGDWSIPVYYSLADDARGILFQGFSPMAFLSPISTPQFEMDVVKDVLTIGSLRLLDILDTDHNRDNPPEPVPPQPIVLRNTSSWCAGTGVSEPINVMRLDPLAQTRFPGNINTNEMQIDYIKRVWGLIKTITWTSSSKDILKTFLAAPILHRTEYKHWESFNKLTTYALPPIAVISSMFAYWRGSIEFRFDIVASQFHTGRLLIAYIPGVDADDKITLAQARCSPYVEFTLNEDEQCIFKIPYIADRPWWPRTASYGDTQAFIKAPSSLFIYVLNPLVPMDSVVPEVYINVYMRGGEDFEVSVPIQPAIGCNRNLVYTLSPSTYYITALPGYSPYYVGSWRLCYDEKRKIYPLIFRYGAISDHVAQFKSPKEDFKKLTYWAANTKGALPSIRHITSHVLYNIDLMVLWGSGGYVYGIPMIDDDAAVNAAQKISQLEYKISDISTHLMDSSQYWLTDAHYGDPNIAWLPQKVSEPQSITFESDKEPKDTSTLGDKFKTLFKSNDNSGDDKKKLTMVEKLTANVADSVSNAVSSKCEDALEKITASLTEAFKATELEVSESRQQMILNGITNVLHCILNPNWKSVALSFASFLVSIGLLAMKYINNVVSIFERIFKKIKAFMPEKKQKAAENESVTQGPTEVLPGPSGTFESNSLETDMSDLLSLICSTFCFGFSWKNKPEYLKKSWAADLSKDLGLYARSSNQLLIFFRNLLNVSKSLVTRIIDWAYPQIHAAKRLKDIYPSLQSWAMEVMTLNHPENKHRLMIDGNFQARVIAAASYACLIRSHIVDETMPNAPAILTTCQEIMALRNSMTRMGRSPTIRKTPWCLYVTGSTGIGKSFLFEEVSSALLKHVGIQLHDVPKTYTYNRASEFWSGCTGKEPIFYMDDAFTTRDPASVIKECNVIYQTVSTSILQPVMAELADKNMYWAPEIMWINSNIAYPSEACMAHKEAIYSRRHCMVKCRLSKEFSKKYPRAQNMRDISAVELREDPKFANFGYLEFGFYPDVIKESEPREWLSYDRFLLSLKSKFKDHYEKEQMSFDMRINSLYEIYDSTMVKVGQELVDHSKELTTQDLDEKYTEIRAKCLADLRSKRLLNGLTVPFIRDGKLLHKFSNLTFWTKMLSIPTFLKNFTSLKKKHEDIVSGELETPETKAVVLPKKLWDTDDEDEGEEVVGELTPEQSDFFAKYNRIPTEADLKAWRTQRKFQAPESKSIEELFEEQLAKLNLSSEIAADLRQHVEYDNNLCSMFATLVPKGQTTKIKSYSQLFAMFQKYKGSDCYHCTHSKILQREFTYDYINDQFIFFVQDVEVRLPGKVCSFEPCLFSNKIFAYLAYRKFLLCPFNRAKVQDKKMVYVPPIFHQFVAAQSRFKSFVERLNTYIAQSIELIKGGLKSIWKFVKSNWFYILLSITAVGIPSGIAYLQVSEDRTLQMEENAAMIRRLRETHGYQGAYNTSDMVPKSIKIPDRVLKGEAANQEVDSAIKIIQGNLVRLMVFYENGEKFRQFQIVMLKNRQALYILHYHQEIKYIFKTYPDSKLFFVEGENTTARYIPLIFEDLKPVWFSTKIDDSNIGVLELPVRIRMFRDITKFIASQNQHNAFGTEGRFINREFIKFTDIKKETFYRIDGDENVTGMIMDVVYTYPISASGLCGSILISNQLSKGIIIGVHIAGDGRKGASEPIYREMFEPLKEHKNECVSITIPHLDDCALAKIMPETDIYPLGVISADLAHSESGKTQIVPSEIAGVFEIRTEPNPLVPSDPRLPADSSPMKLGVEKHGIVPRGFPDSIIRTAYYSLRDKILAHCKPVKLDMEPWSLQDVCCGNVEIPHCEPLNWTSAEGFFLNKYKPPGMKGKKWLFDLEESSEGYKLKGLHPILKQQMALKDALRKRKIRPFTVFTDCLKDTRLPKEKCRIPGKTRIFSTSPVDFQIQFKQYYQNFISSYQHHRQKCEHAIGIDVDSLEWTEYARLLQSKGLKVVSGDYSNFGPGMIMEFVWYAFEIIIDWYRYYGASESYCEYLGMLRDEIMNANHLCMNLIYTVASSIPSGSPITTPLNSLVNCLYIRACYIDCGLTLSSFDSNVEVVTYGDDVVINISDSIAEKFNLQTMSDAFLKRGIVFTHCSKASNVQPYEALRDITFLKRRWLPHPFKRGIYLAALDKISVEDTANWITKKNSLREGSLLNSEQCLLNSFGWGPEYYNYVKDKLIQEWRKLHVHVSYKSWDEIDTEKYSG
ncbi:hypothetical protein [Hubei odonate virus 3]|uniref:hypothetical protein n=1 Tax=Hubei odonate virus 3 TaxID=1922998 RepID=UPI00090AABAC|nr:hypothetical protein [Hubei odonate virus 3]APG77972.1 hypothetical protein [Hubei odonate virus 3]